MHGDGRDDSSVGATIAAGSDRASRRARGSRWRRLGRCVVALTLALGVLASCGSASGPEAADPGAPGLATTIPEGLITDDAPTPVWVDDALVPGEDRELVEVASDPVVVTYGPDPAHVMDVHRSVGEPRGTILYVHGGAWVSGSRSDTGSPGFRLVMGETLRGWDVVSIDYRLAPQAAGSGVRAPELLADVDRAVRFTRQHAGELGLDVSTFVIAGGSAGGHLALMHAQGAPTDEFADPDLPSELAAVPATVDAVLAVVAPTDLHTEWMAGGVAPGGQESLLGCTLAEEPTIAGMGPCDLAVVDRYSPLWWSLAAVSGRQTLPPAYLAYGGSDTLVPPETQATPNLEVWAAAAGANQTWVDLPAAGGHDLDDHVDVAAFEAWLDNVDSGSWD